jgi:hypothetical protein
MDFISYLSTVVEVIENFSNLNHYEKETAKDGVERNTPHYW